ncbi:PDR/VanB family oxidoreductase [Microbacterium album]|uniref:Ferredoxin n=1 Tax=Microbacterium album TaxID=2053191 RepID=A0A917MKJ9_9MICO|nr:PDR/VanB family oxidoreductase [Microbacterium album]GGH33292.1 ferredoxin [Microbacterium album]
MPDERTRSAQPEPAAHIDLIVRGMRWEADGILLLALERPEGGDLPAWEPGAHVDLRLPNGVERQYSLCSDPDDRTTWHVAVLREDISRGGSRYVHGDLRPGQRLTATLPRNNFALVEAPETIFVAGGIGITPLLPMIRRVAASGRRWRLAYLGRSLDRMAYVRDALLTGPEVTLVAADRDQRLELAEWIGTPQAGAAVYACGPARMLDALEELSLDWPRGTLHLERFQPRVFADADDASTFDVEARRSGLRVTVEPHCSILETLERAGIGVPNSCLEGVCGTCETRIIDGEAEHRDSILAPDEREANETMMICVSRSRRPTLVLDI